jgi:hypothetical protein
MVTPEWQTWDNIHSNSQFKAKGSKLGFPQQRMSLLKAVDGPLLPLDTSCLLTKEDNRPLSNIPPNNSIFRINSSSSKEVKVKEEGVRGIMDMHFR